MNERPILFSAPMVRAILEGRKTQTRRVCKVHAGAEPNPPHVDAALWSFSAGPDHRQFRCPYGIAGDRLWVRETHAFLWPDESGYTVDEATGLERPWTARECNVEYKADTNNPYPGDWPEDQAKGYDEAPKWKPSIHMPRHASRILLKVVNVRVQRLQDVTRGDCMAEGCPFPNMADGPSPRDWYTKLWGDINGKGSWERNPWVWVVEFKRVQVLPCA